MQPYLPARWVVASVDAVDDPNVYPAAPGAGFYALKTPIWSTAVATASSGKERRQQRWSYPKWTFTIPYEVMRDTPNTPEVQRLWAFFNSHGGMAGEFCLRDASDHIVSGQPFGTGDGVTTTFQLCRTMGTAGIGFTEPVRAIIGTPEIMIAGVDTTAFTIGSYGKITFATPPVAGAALTWTGQFYYLVRFMADQFDTAQVMAGAWSSGGVLLQTIKP